MRHHDVRPGSRPWKIGISPWTLSLLLGTAILRWATLAPAGDLPHAQPVPSPAPASRTVHSPPIPHGGRTFDLEYLRLREAARPGETAPVVPLTGQVVHRQHAETGLSDVRIFLGTRVGTVPGGKGLDIVQGEGLTAAAISGPDGSFALAAPPGTYEALLWKRDFLPRRIRVTIPGRDLLQISLSPAPELSHTRLSWKPDSPPSPPARAKGRGKPPAGARAKSGRRLRPSGTAIAAR
ncbi:MAG: hypothetical protein GX442_06555 [Candidatus Riflebacteria bacterium]|nr:hypothetical protein [Candidatus Riflebacteria bacterium]